MPPAKVTTDAIPVINSVAGWDPAHVYEANVKKNPANYHIGMAYLTGKQGPADATVCWTEDDMVASSSYIHLVRDKSTLGKAKVWIDR